MRRNWGLNWGRMQVSQVDSGCREKVIHYLYLWIVAFHYRYHYKITIILSLIGILLRMHYFYHSNLISWSAGLHPARLRRTGGDIVEKWFSITERIMVLTANVAVKLNWTFLCAAQSVCVLTLSTSVNTRIRFLPRASLISSSCQSRLSSSATRSGYFETSSRPVGTLPRRSVLNKCLLQI